MDGCSCPKGENGYHKWLCSIQKCKDCKDTKPAPLKCSSSKELVTFDQFEVVKREYKKLNPKTNVLEIRTAQLTESVTKQITYEESYSNLVMFKRNTAGINIKSTMIFINGLEFSQQFLNMVLFTTHMDPCENMAQMHKYEVQSAHFDKRDYFLHCTVEHIDDDKN